MRTILISSIILLFLLTFSNCSKSKSEKWLIADVYVLNSANGNPISNKQIKLYYELDPLLGEVQDEQLVLGNTDENGYLNVEQKVSKRMGGFEIGTLTAGQYNNVYDKKISVYVKKKNVVVFEL